jgi:hypothetical protein
MLPRILWLTTRLNCRKPGGLFTHAFATPAFAEKQPSMSIHEEATISTSMPMLGVFNNLVMFDPKEKQNKLSNIVPDLADS